MKINITRAQPSGLATRSRKKRANLIPVRTRPQGIPIRFLEKVWTGRKGRIRRRVWVLMDKRVHPATARRNPITARNPITERIWAPPKDSPHTQGYWFYPPIVGPEPLGYAVAKSLTPRLKAISNYRRVRFRNTAIQLAYSLLGEAVSSALVLGRVVHFPGLGSFALIPRANRRVILQFVPAHKFYKRMIELLGGDEPRVVFRGTQAKQKSRSGKPVDLYGEKALELFLQRLNAAEEEDED